jgi:hypothetical protein
LLFGLEIGHGEWHKCLALLNTDAYYCSAAN